MHRLVRAILGRVWKSHQVPVIGRSGAGDRAQFPFRSPQVPVPVITTQLRSHVDQKGAAWLCFASCLRLDFIWAAIQAGGETVQKQIGCEPEMPAPLREIAKDNKKVQAAIDQRILPIKLSADMVGWKNGIFFK